MTQYGGDETLDTQVNTAINILSGSVAIFGTAVANIAQAFQNNQ